MKVLILAGGYGTRLGSITESVPKPMVQIGNRPILWHIMKIYSHYGLTDFVITCGYKAEVIKRYFYWYNEYYSDFTVNLNSKMVEKLNYTEPENWNVTIIDTGIETLKGARIKRVEDQLDDLTLMTYGDGVANIDIDELVKYHKSHGKMITISGVHPPSRFGEIREKNGILKAFEEKPQTSSGLINGGFMVFNHNFLDRLSPEPDCDLEYGVFENLAEEEQIMVFKHEGQWACVDTERDLKHLEKLWQHGQAFWKLW